MMRPRAHAFVILSLGVIAAAGAALSTSASGCVFRSADDCSQNLGFGCGTGGAGTGATGTGAGGTSSSSGGTGGKAAECTDSDLSHCPQEVPPGPCHTLGKPACLEGKCGFAYDTTTPTPSQQYGDCKTKMCDAGGAIVEVPDPTDKYDTGNPCIQGGCANDMPTRTLLTGMACSIGGSTGVCVQDMTYAAIVTCSECMPPGTSTCTGGAMCSPEGTCVPATCTNGTKDPGETDVDCGGATSGCPKCSDPAHLSCLSGQDCASGVCSSSKCAAPTCIDGKQNQDETDVDCGGTICVGHRCDADQKCRLPSDCISGVCLPSMTAGMPNTCAAPSCTDGVQNGDEDGVDCGGTVSNCPPCAPPP